MSVALALCRRWESEAVEGMADVGEQLRAAGFEGGEGLWRRGDEVGAVLTPAGVFVGWLDVDWDGPSTPEWVLRDVLHLPVGSYEQDLDEAVASAHQRGEAARRECRYCEGRFVPGHMHSQDVCQGCAERHLGVVH